MKKKLIAMLLSAAMCLSLAACGKETATEPNLIKLGDRELLYKGACIMEDSSGNDAVVLTLDFTNNGKENASYLWSVDETVMQNGVELEVASIITNYDTFETVVDNQFKEVAPGATLEVKTAFVLSDTTSEIKATFEELLALPGVGRKSANLIMGDVFGKPAIVTDTHCIRLCNRIGLVHDCKDPKKVEMALWKIVPPEEGSSLCHRFVEHGREVCTARTTPHCERCVLADICEKNGVEK